MSTDGQAGERWRAIAKGALRESGLPYALETTGVSQQDSTWFASFLANDGTVRKVSVDTTRFTDDGAIKGEVIRQLTK
jgi:hypothetical protein